MFDAIDSTNPTLSLRCFRLVQSADNDFFLATRVTIDCKERQGTRRNRGIDFFFLRIVDEWILDWNKARVKCFFDFHRRMKSSAWGKKEREREREERTRKRNARANPAPNRVQIDENNSARSVGLTAVWR